MSVPRAQGELQSLLEAVSRGEALRSIERRNGRSGPMRLASALASLEALRVAEVVTQPLKLLPRQERVLARLQLVGPGPAAFYQDALRLLSAGDSLECASHLVSHCYREIESALQDVLLPDGLSREERKFGDTNKDSHCRKVQAILNAYGIDHAADVAKLWVRIATKEDDDALHRAAHRNALVSPRPFDAAFRAHCDELEALFDAVLDRFEAQFARHLQFVDELAQTAEPNSEHVKRLRTVVPNSRVTMTRFFDQIDARWVSALRGGGCFTVVPASGPWPASTYLARVAPLADEQTLGEIGAIAIELPESENPWVNRDLVRIALAVEPDVAEALARRHSPKLRGALPGFAEDLAGLAERLAGGGRAAVAVELLRLLLGVEISKGTAMADRDVRVRPVYDRFEFDQVVRKKIAGVVARAGTSGFVVVCDALERAVNLTEPRETSCSFRAAIEDHGQDAGNQNEALSLLIDAVRDAAEEFGRTRPDVVAELLAELERREPLVFRRVALHLSRLFAERVPGAVSRQMLDETTLESIPLWHERRLLERDTFVRLSESEQTAFLGIVRRGPDIDGYRQTQPRCSGRPVTDDDVVRYVRAWKRQHLALIADALPADLRSEYDEIIAELGSAEHPDFLGWVGEVWSGPSAPSSAPELEKLTIDQLFSLFAEFKPQPRFDGPFASREGLARELTKVIGKAPAPFAAAAARFRDQPPVYVRPLLEGLTDAIRAKLTFSWSPVLELCEWVLLQQAEDVLPMAKALDLGEDPGWRWTRMAIARLLTAGLADGPSMLPREHDPISFKMIATLIDDNDQSTMRDPLEQATNTIRGTAAEGLLRWTLRQGVHATGGQLRVTPDASALIERMLLAEPSIGPRAMVGIYLPNLIALDADWVRAHSELLFSHASGAQGHRGAVWKIFVERREPDLASFRLLKDEYERDVLGLGSFHDDARRVDALIRHLAGLYWSGHLSLDEGLLTQFYANSDVRSRAQMVKHMGFCFFHTKGELPDGIREQARLLWERRIALAGSAPSLDGAAELAEFGWWFASAKFETAWSMKQLDAVLNLTDHVQLDHAVAERLGVLAQTDPVGALRLLSKMMSRATDWSAIACRHGIESAVKTALASSEPDAHSVARELVSRLAAHGHEGFIRLLSP